MEIFKVPEEHFMSPKMDNSYARPGILVNAGNANKGSDDPNKPSTAVTLPMSKDDILLKKAFIFACGKNLDGELGLQPVSD